MLPSVFSRLFFGEAKEEDEDKVDKSEEILKKTTLREENNDWLLISLGEYSSTSLAVCRSQ